MSKWPLVLYATLLMAACAAAPGDCPGGQCNCGEETWCHLSCTGPGCTFYCPPSAVCGFECEQGGCVVTCDESPSCDLSCPGGGCVVRCDGGANCEIHDCPECPFECEPPSFCDYHNDKEI